MKNIKLVIEYDGTNYGGWQVQKNNNSIQEEIEKALRKLTGKSHAVTGASRTDAGVHAKGQVANFLSETKLNLRTLQSGINAFLPDDIYIRNAVYVPLNFNSRFKALRKTYLYTLLSVPSPLNLRYGWYYKNELDITAMNWACKKLLGAHDFRSFCVAKSVKPNFICTITYMKWKRIKNGVIFKVEGNRFLHNMVRILVGTMITIGGGKIKKEMIVNIMNKKLRMKAGMTVPPQGLVLDKIKYR